MNYLNPFSYLSSLAAMISPAIPGENGGPNRVEAGDIAGGMTHHLNNTIENIVPMILKGATFAVSQTAVGPLENALTGVLEYIDEREKPPHNYSFGDAPRKLRDAQAELTRCKLAHKTSSTKENQEALSAAVRGASKALEEANVHAFGMSLKPVGLPEGGVSLSDISLKVPTLAPERVTAPTKEEFKKEFEKERDVLVTNLRRMALVETVYQYAMGRKSSPKEIEDLYSKYDVSKADRGNWKKMDADFKAALFKQMDKDLKNVWCAYRPFMYVKSYLTYYATSFVLSYIMDAAGKFGFDQLGKQINRLHDKETVDVFHIHLFNALAVHFDDTWSQYEVLNEKKGTKGKTIDQSIFSLFKGDDNLRLGRGEKEFNDLLIDHVLKHTALLYPIRKAVASILKSNDAVGSLLKAAGSSTKDKAGFSYNLDVMLTDVIKELIPVLKAPVDEEGNLSTPKASDDKGRAISGFFQALFSVVPLMKIQSTEKLRKHFKEGSLIDDTVKERVLHPAAEGGLNTLSLAVDRFLEADKAKELSLKTVHAFNAGFSSNEDVTDTMKLAAQRELSRRTDEVLDIVIDDSLNSIPVLNADVERDVANGYITRLKEKTNTFASDIEGALNAGEYSAVNRLWNTYVQEMETHEGKMKEDGRIGDTIKQELAKGYYSKVGGTLAVLSREDRLIESRDEAACRTLVRKLRRDADSMYHMLSCDVGGETLSLTMKNITRGKAKSILQDQVTGVKTLLRRETTIPFGVQQLVFVPFLKTEGIEMVEPALGDVKV